MTRSRALPNMLTEDKAIPPLQTKGWGTRQSVSASARNSITEDLMRSQLTNATEVGGPV